MAPRHSAKDTQDNDTQHNDTEYNGTQYWYAEGHCAEYHLCRVLLMLCVTNEPIMLSVIMLAHFLLIIKIKKRTSLFAGMGMREGKKV